MNEAGWFRCGEGKGNYRKFRSFTSPMKLLWVINSLAMG